MDPVAAGPSWPNADQRKARSASPWCINPETSIKSRDQEVDLILPGPLKRFVSRALCRRSNSSKIPIVTGVWFEEGGYLPSESDEESSESQRVGEERLDFKLLEDQKLSRTEASEAGSRESGGCQGSAVSTRLRYEPEDGEIQWKKPDLKGWDPKPDQILQSGKRRGLGGKGAEEWSSRIPDLAAVLHSESERKKAEELSQKGGYLISEEWDPEKKRYHPNLDLAPDPAKAVREYRERKKKKEELKRLRFDETCKKWLLPSGRAATDQEIQLFLAREPQIPPKGRRSQQRTSTFRKEAVVKLIRRHPSRE